MIKFFLGLIDEEIECMVKDVEVNVEVDKVCKEEVDLCNDVDVLLFFVDKILKELEGKVDEEEVKKVEIVCDELKVVVEVNNIEEMKIKCDVLNEIV